MGKTRDLFKKIGDTKGTFHAEMGTIKGRNDKDLIEAEDIKKRWQGCTEKLYKTVLNDSDNHDGVITYLESDMTERLSLLVFLFLWNGFGHCLLYYVMNIHP